MCYYIHKIQKFGGDNIKKVVVNTDENNIIFSYKIDEPDFIDISEYTNVIDNSNLVFNEAYIRTNKEIISYFLKGIISDKGLHSIVVNDYDLIDLTLDIIENIKELNSLFITPNEKLNFDLCDKLSNNKNLTSINCYDMPEFMFEKLNQRNDVKIDLRCEIFSVSNFISENKLTTFSSIYYKDSININKLMDNEDLDDLETFCKINRNLKLIEMNYYFIGDIKKIIEILKKNNVRNIKIQITTNSNNFNSVEESIAYLKTLNKRLKKTNNIKIKIKYTNDYKKEKEVKQFSLNCLKICGCILTVSSLATIGFLTYYDYSAQESTDEVQKIAKRDNENNNSKKNEVNEDTGVEVNDEELKQNDQLTENYDELRSINPDTVGWIKVNNTSVDYPVVQTIDNDYYLKRSFYKKVNGIGWIFMDYRNDINDMSRNTVIYGHNMRGNSKLMFTTLQKTLDEKWYTNKDNQIITFNTTNQNMKWQIFSIYVADPSDEYIQTKFATENIFLEFANTQKSKSIYDFGVTITNEDKILTLSTCAEKGTKRLVIHAKLIN